MERPKYRKAKGQKVKERQEKKLVRKRQTKEKRDVSIDRQKDGYKD